MDDSIFPSDEELVEEEDETPAAEEVDDSDDGTEDSDDGGEVEEDEDDARAPVAKTWMKALRDPGWHRDLFHLLAKEPDYFSEGEKQSKARERILTSLREKHIDVTAKKMKDCTFNWTRRYSTPPWLTQEERVIMEKIRKTAEHLTGSSKKIKGRRSGKMSKSDEFTQQLFKELVKIPDYFEMEDRRSANKKIVDALRKKKIDTTSKQVIQKVFYWIWRNYTPRWMSAKETAALEEMRKAAERWKEKCKSTEFGQHLFQQLKNIPEYFEMEDRSSANRKIVDALRKKDIDRKSGQVRKAVFRWMKQKKTPRWMKQEDKAILEEMRKTADRVSRNSSNKRNRPRTPASAKNSCTSHKKRRLQKSSAVSDDEEESKKQEEAGNEPNSKEQVSDGDDSDQVEDEMKDNGGEQKKKKKKPEGEPLDAAIHFDADDFGAVPMDEVPTFDRNSDDYIDSVQKKTPSKKRRRRIQENPEDFTGEAEEEKEAAVEPMDKEQRDVALHEDEDQVFEGDEQAEDREKENEVELEGVRFDQEDDAYNGLEAYDFPFEAVHMEPMDVVLPPDDVNSGIPSPDRTVDSDESTEALENDGLAAFEDSSDSEPFDPMDDGPSPVDVIPESATMPFAGEDSAENDDEFKSDFQIGASNSASAPNKEKIEALHQKHLPPSSGLPPPIEQKKTEKAPVPQEFRISPDEEEEETRVDSLLRFYDEIAKYKELVAQKDKQILKLEKKTASKDEELRKFKEELKKKSDENEALKNKLGEAQKRPDEVVMDEDAGEVEEKDVPEDMKPLLKLKGRIVGNKYSIQQAIGVGTFGLVFRANHTETKEVSALKLVVDQEVMEEELRVMKRMQKFEEKNQYICAPSYSFRGRHGGVEFLAFSMELLPGDLYSFFWMSEHKKKAFPSESVLQILAQLFSALDFLNRHGIVYSDVKPDNLMMKTFDVETRGDEDLVRNPVVRLIDFNAIREEGTPCSLCQTAHLRSPEVILGLDFDAKIDSWSAGILALELLEKNYFIDIEYPVKDKKKPYEHLGLISFALNTPIPTAMWAKSSLDPRRFPKKIGDQLSVAEVFEEMKSSFFTDALQKFVAQLLVIDPSKRLSPKEALSIVEDLLPR